LCQDAFSGDCNQNAICAEYSNALDQMAIEVAGIRDRLSSLANYQPSFNSVPSESFAPNRTFQTQTRFFPCFQKPQKKQKVSRRLLTGPGEVETADIRRRLLSYEQSSPLADPDDDSDMPDDSLVTTECDDTCNRNEIGKIFRCLVLLLAKNDNLFRFDSSYRSVLRSVVVCCLA